jgi:hypothetical protein
VRGKVSSPLRGEVARSAGGDVAYAQAAPTPTWLWAALLAGAVVTAWWAWFVFGFIQEPSAVGRLLVGLLTLIGTSTFAGLTGLLASLGLVRNAPWGRPMAWIAAIFITLTGVGAIAGVPVLVGLWWSRKASRP